MDIDTVSSLMMSAAEAHASASKVRLGDGAHSLFEGYARKAANEIVRLPEAEQRQRLKAANAAFERLVDTMIEQSNQIPGYEVTHSGIIGEQSLARALDKLCPLWPFC